MKVDVYRSDIMEIHIVDKIPPPKISKEHMDAMMKSIDRMSKMIRCPKCKGTGKVRIKIRHGGSHLQTCNRCKGFKKVDP